MFTSTRLSRFAAHRVVRRLARQVGIEHAVSPHSLRHGFVTAALDAGVSLRDVQDAAGHADPRTTRRYDRGRNALERTYREAGVSGAKERRPALDRLLSDLDGIDVVVVSSLDRLGRSTRHLLEMYEVFERESVAFVSLRENIDSLTSTGRLLRTVLSAVAEFERDLGRERTSSAIGSRARTGQPWGEPAYGYAKGEGGRWIAEPTEAAIVRRIYADYVERIGSYSGVARQLNADGIRPRRGARWSPTVTRRC